MNRRKHRQPEKWLPYLYFMVCFSLLFTVDAQASYIDPSVMTYAIQAIAGVLIGLGTFFGLYWRKIRKMLLHICIISYQIKELMLIEPFIIKCILPLIKK